MKRLGGAVGRCGGEKYYYPRLQAVCRLFAVVGGLEKIRIGDLTSLWPTCVGGWSKSRGKC